MRDENAMNTCALLAVSFCLHNLSQLISIRYYFNFLYMFHYFKGERSGIHNWPYIVALYKDGRFHCGATILNKNWVILFFKL